MVQTEGGPYRWTDNGDGSVTLNVEVVPGLYYAADSAATIKALRRPSATEPAKAGYAVADIAGFPRIPPDLV